MLEDGTLVTNNIEFQQTLVDDEGSWTIQVIYPEGITEVPPLLGENETLISLDATEIPENVVVKEEFVKRKAKAQTKSTSSACLLENGYVCPNCDKVYNARKNLTRHLNLECGKEPQFACPYCTYRNHRRNEIKKHVRNRHNVYYCST